MQNQSCMARTTHPSSNAAAVCVCVFHRAPPQAAASELEVISQQVEEDNQCPVQLVSFAYRDLPLAGLDISLAGSQLISNPDEEDNREGYVPPPPIRHTTCHFLLLLDTWPQAVKIQSSVRFEWFSSFEAHPSYIEQNLEID